MRSIHLLPIAAALTLSACGGGGEPSESGAESVDEPLAKVAEAVQIKPGYYRGSYEVLEFDALDLPEAGERLAEQLFTSELTPLDYCLTEQDVAENGAEMMVRNVAEGGCTMSRFNVSGSTIVATMQCPGEAGNQRDVSIEGQLTADGSTLTMVSDQVVPNVGQVNLRTRVTSKWVGACPPSPSRP